MTFRDISINGGTPRNVTLTRGGRRSRIWLGSDSLEAARSTVGQNWEVEVDGLSARVTLVVDKDMVLIHVFGRTWRVGVTDPAGRALLTGSQSDVAKAPMPGVTISVLVSPGAAVIAGQAMVIIESMKMQTEITASRAGTVDQVHARLGESFPLGAPLVTLVPLPIAGA
jgi:acetyl/propionyl-CoA carboxylase alpha subunit